MEKKRKLSRQQTQVHHSILTDVQVVLPSLISAWSKYCVPLAQLQAEWILLGSSCSGMSQAGELRLRQLQPAARLETILIGLAAAMFVNKPSQKNADVNSTWLLPMRAPNMAFCVLNRNIKSTQHQSNTRQIIQASFFEAAAQILPGVYPGCSQAVLQYRLDMMLTTAVPQLTSLETAKILV